jgi:hypothetical protein
MNIVPFLGSLALAAICWAPAVAQPTTDESPNQLKQRAYHDALAAAVKVHEVSLASELKLQQQGASSEMDVNGRRQVLAILRHDAALNNEDPDGAREQTRALIKLREANVERLSKLRAAGAVPAVLLLAARRQVANAKYILSNEGDETEDPVVQLKIIVEICAAELQRVEDSAKSGGASPAEVSLIRGRKAYAHYLLEHENDEPAKAIAQLRIVVAERENAANRIEKLYRAGAAGRINFVETQHNLLWARANLAIEEDQRETTRDILKKLVEFTKENLGYWKTHPDVATPELIARNQSALADCELRLAQSGDANTPLKSLLRKPIYELDY